MINLFKWSYYYDFGHEMCLDLGCLTRSNIRYSLLRLTYSGSDMVDWKTRLMSYKSLSIGMGYGNLFFITLDIFDTHFSISLFNHSYRNWSQWRHRWRLDT